jgi:sugar phosphate isomerase/epimerase
MFSVKAIEEIIKKARRIEDVDGLELCYPSDFENVTKIRKAMTDARLGVSAINVRSRRQDKWFRGSFTSSDARERQESKVIIFGTGNARLVPQGFSVSKASRQFVDLLSVINQYAGDFGITIAINIVSTYREALELGKLADCPQIKWLRDYYHLFEENESIRIIQSNNKSLAHVHFSEPLGRVLPIEKTRCNTLLFFKS